AASRTRSNLRRPIRSLPLLVVTSDFLDFGFTDDFYPQRRCISLRLVIDLGLIGLLEISQFYLVAALFNVSLIVNTYDLFAHFTFSFNLEGDRSLSHPADHAFYFNSFLGNRLCLRLGRVLFPGFFFLYLVLFRWRRLLSDYRCSRFGLFFN